MDKEQVYVIRTILPEQVPLHEALRQSQQEWDNAYSLFNSVTDFILIDKSIYSMKVAELQLQYDLKHRVSNTPKVHIETRFDKILRKVGELIGWLQKEEIKL